MDVLKEYWTILIGSCAGVFMWLFGSLDMSLQVLCVLMIIDYITGVLAAKVEGNISSQLGYKGILKKVGILICVIVAVMTDRLLGTDNALRLAIILCFVGNEGVSILENVARMGVPIPKKLLDALAQLKGKDGENS